MIMKFIPFALFLLAGLLFGGCREGETAGGQQQMIETLMQRTHELEAENRLIHQTSGSLSQALIVMACALGVSLAVHYIRSRRHAANRPRSAG